MRSLSSKSLRLVLTLTLLILQMNAASEEVPSGGVAVAGPENELRRTGRWAKTETVLLKDARGNPKQFFTADQKVVRVPLADAEKTLWVSKARYSRRIYLEGKHFAIHDSFVLYGKDSFRTYAGLILISDNSQKELGRWAFRGDTATAFREPLRMPNWSADGSTAVVVMLGGNDRATLPSEDLVIFRAGRAEPLLTPQLLRRDNVGGYGLNPEISEHGSYVSFLNVLLPRNNSAPEQYDTVRVKVDTREVRIFPGCLGPLSVSEMGEVSSYCSNRLTTLK